MLLRVSTVLPAPIAVCWELLKKTSTLSAIADGVVTYDGAKDLPEEWAVGVTTNLLPRRNGHPQGNHFVTVVEIEPEQRKIVTKETGDRIHRLDHTMELLPAAAGPDQCIYTDTIQIIAGRETYPAWRFAQYFYHHRHEKLKQLLVH